MSDITARTGGAGFARAVVNLFYEQTMLIILILLIIVMSIASQGLPFLREPLQRDAPVLRTRDHGVRNDHRDHRQGDGPLRRFHPRAVRGGQRHAPALRVRRLDCRFPRRREWPAVCINGYLIAKVKANFIIVTLGTQIIFTGVALIITGGMNLRSRPEPLFHWLGEANILGMPALGWSLVLIMVVSGVLLARTIAGRRLYAVGLNDRAARASGINDTRIVLAELRDQRPDLRPRVGPPHLPPAAHPGGNRIGLPLRCDHDCRAGGNGAFRAEWGASTARPSGC